LFLALLGVLFALSHPIARADQTITLNSKEHAWGRFEPGAWKRVRATTRTYDSDGSVLNTRVQETITRLVGKDANGVQLGMSAWVEVSGRKIDQDELKIDTQFCGARGQQQAKLTDAGTAKVRIDGHDYLCKILVAKITDEANRRVTTTEFYTCERTRPQILRTVSRTTKLDDGEEVSTTKIHATSAHVDRNVKLLDGEQSLSTMVFEASYTNGVSQATSEIVSSALVPGEVVSSTTRETDMSGRLLRVTELKLLDYDYEPYSRKRRRQRARQDRLVGHPEVLEIVGGSK